METSAAVPPGAPAFSGGVRGSCYGIPPPRPPYGVPGTRVPGAGPHCRPPWGAPGLPHPSLWDTDIGCPVRFVLFLFQLPGGPPESGMRTGGPRDLREPRERGLGISAAGKLKKLGVAQQPPDWLYPVTALPQLPARPPTRERQLLGRVCRGQPSPGRPGLLLAPAWGLGRCTPGELPRAAAGAGTGPRCDQQGEQWAFGCHELASVPGSSQPAVWLWASIRHNLGVPAGLVSRAATWWPLLESAADCGHSLVVASPHVQARPRLQKTRSGAQ